jgi:RND family efflux transporter MFP subunit
MYLFRPLFTVWTLLAMLFLSGCSDAEEKNRTPDVPEPPKVHVHTLKKRSYPIWIYFTGKTQAIDEVNVISRVKGELKAEHFKPGQQVKKGDLLFTVDKSDYQSAWDQAYAILQKDKASYTLAKANVRRYTPLVKEQLAPQEKLDELTATLRQLEATINADEAAVAKAKLNLSYCEIRATIDGQIGKPFILTGNIVNIGDILSKIVKSDKLYVNFNPSAQEVALIKQYSKEKMPHVKVYVQGSTMEALEGQIDFIDNVSNASTGTVAMRAVVDNTEGLVFPGSFVEVELFLGEYNVLAVHPDQISQDQLGEYVLLADANQTVRSVHVTPFFSNNDLVLVKDALKEGDRVLVDIVNGLAEGMKVTPVEVANPVKVK